MKNPLFCVFFKYMHSNYYNFLLCSYQMAAFGCSRLVVAVRKRQVVSPKLPKFIHLDTFPKVCCNKLVCTYSHKPQLINLQDSRAW